MSFAIGIITIFLWLFVERTNIANECRHFYSQSRFWIPSSSPILFSEGYYKQTKRTNRKYMYSVAHISSTLYLGYAWSYITWPTNTTETYRKDKILWKRQTAFQKIYMLVVLRLYSYNIMTRWQCLESIIFWVIIFSDSLLEKIILWKNPISSTKKNRALAWKFVQNLALFVVIFTSQEIRLMLSAKIPYILKIGTLLLERACNRDF